MGSLRQFPSTTHHPHSTCLLYTSLCPEICWSQTHAVVGSKLNYGICCWRKTCYTMKAIQHITRGNASNYLKKCKLEQLWIIFQIIRIPSSRIHKPLKVLRYKFRYKNLVFARGRNFLCINTVTVLFLYAILILQYHMSMLRYL